jgi:tetratricopeptide (TPR) repeat protein/DNA-binding PadR family transcriptional regulator
MVDHSTESVVLLHLARRATEGHHVEGDTVSGIAEAVGLGKENVAERVSLLSTLRGLENDGLVETRVASVPRRSDGDRNVYGLTAAGRRRAEQLRGELAEETVVVEDGDREEVRLSETDRYFADGMVRALSELDDDGVIYLDDDVGERFVNRTAELDRLSEVLETVLDGSPRFVLLSGEAGIGKTTLISEFEDRARERGVAFARGRCESTGGDPYGPIVEAFAGIPGGDAVVETLESIEAPGTTGGDGEFESPRAMDARREATLYEFADEIRRLVERRPLVVFLDDLQWATAGTVELLGYVAMNVDDGRPLIGGAYRPEDLPEDDYLLRTVESIREDRLERVELDRFGRAETSGLVEWVLETRSVPSEFVAAVHDRTGGNPLFVEESVKRLREEHLVDPDLNIYPEDLSPNEVPEAVEATVDMRLGALDDRSRRVLEVGAVVGDRVPVDLLATVSSVPEPALRDRVDVLVGARVWERTDEDGVVRYPSGVIRETVVERMDDDRRDRLHRAVARAMQETDDGAEKDHATVAEHYDLAGDHDAAIECFRKAGEAAEDVFAHRDAIDHYGRALELARAEGRTAETLEILETLGRIHYALGEFDESLKHCEFVRDRTDDETTQCEMLNLEIDVLTNKGEYEDALARVETAETLEGTDYTRCKLLSVEGWVHHRLGNHEQAAETFDRELAIAEELDDTQRSAKAHHDVGVGRLYLDEIEAAIDHFETALDRWDRDSPRRASTYNNLGIAHRRRGDVEAAIDSYERALEIAEKTDHVLNQSLAISNLSPAYAQVGALDRAIQYAERSREISERIGDEMGVALALANLGIHYASRGDYAASRDVLEDALERLTELGNDDYVAMTLQHLTIAHFELGDVDAAIETARRGIDVATEAGNGFAEMVLRLWLARALERADDGAGAREQYRTVTESESNESEPELLDNRIDAGLVEGALLRELGRLEESAETLEPTLEDAMQLGAPLKLLDAHAELARTRLELDEQELARERFESARSIAAANGIDDRRALYEGRLDDLNAGDTGT